MQSSELKQVDRAMQQSDKHQQVMRGEANQQQVKSNKDEIYEHFECDHNATDQNSASPVANFYKGRNVFITGASGFVGKCLLEKLIRSCPDIGKVYILMRPKRGVDIEERLRNVLESELFSRLRKMPGSSEALKKIIPIRGDITEPLFGLNESDIALLDSQVSLVFHSAATVKFVEPLKVAVANNVVSVGNLVELASRLKNLQALVHVSTAYSNCDRKNVDEIFYEAPIEAEKLIEMAHWMETSLFEKIAPILIGRRPNTYTYTKAVAESLLVKRARKLLPHVPIAMVRPSIVAGTWQQPIKGWVDNFNGPTGVILSMATGVLQAMPAEKSYCADIVPVDIVVNLIICAAYHLKNKQPLQQRLQPARDNDDGQDDDKDSSSSISIFNCVSGTLNPIFWHDILRCVKNISKDFPMNDPFRDPGFILMSNQYLFPIFNFFSHKCVAYFGDFCLKLIGKKQSLVIIYSRLNKMVATLRPFTTNQWLFDCTNVTSLYESLDPIDRELFNFDVRQVAWDDYITRYYIGSKTFALKDDPKRLSNARHTRMRMKTGSRAAQLLLLMIAYYYLVSGTSLEQYLWQAIGVLLPNSLQQYVASTPSSDQLNMNGATNETPHLQLAAATVASSSG